MSNEKIIADKLTKPNETNKELELEEIIVLSRRLHEDLRNYGQLSEQEKPLVVSAILLALEDETLQNGMTGDEFLTDGERIFSSLQRCLDTADVGPKSKKDIILNQFSFIRDRVKLSKRDPALRKTPLKHFTDFLNSNIKQAITANTKEDVLGKFYGEFVRYSGGDGRGLGIVLTPAHITELMCDLVCLNPDDIVLDPCTGTGGFLVSAMHRMLSESDNEGVEGVKKDRLYGIEIREDLFSIAKTNMIIRGDEKNNLRCTDFMNEDLSTLQAIGATKGLMNPPYSQAKNKGTAHLSEMGFINRMLDALAPRGKGAVIVPQSTMVGKTKKNKESKERLLKHHTLEAVVTLNQNTFYGIGASPCIAVFTAHEPHPEKKKVKFFNFEEDGYVVRKYIGLIATNKAKDKKNKLLNTYFNNHEAPASFLIESTIKAEHEWLHSFYYFNDEIPSAEDFKKTMADYLTFEFDMKSHGKEYLFEEEKNA